PPPAELHSFPTRRSSDLGGIQRLRGVRDDQGGSGTGIPRRTAGRARVADGDQARRRRLRHLLLDQGARKLALKTRSELFRRALEDRKSTRLNSSHDQISY